MHDIMTTNNWNRDETLRVAVIFFCISFIKYEHLSQLAYRFSHSRVRPIRGCCYAFASLFYSCKPRC